jgi:branched-chain amino acid transport system ATP-binding protein
VRAASFKSCIWAPSMDEVGSRPTALLDVRDIHTYYGASHVLHGVSVSVDAGKCLAVVGRNGVGKTTLMRSILGFTPPRRGSMWLEGSEITHLPTFKIARAGVGIVPQGRRLFASLSVAENLRVVSGGGRGSVPITDLLHRFPSLQNRQRQRAGNLSGGEQQMLAIARALVLKPRLLLLDEPTEGLAPQISAEVGRLIVDLLSQGIGIVLVEQNLRFAMRFADEVCVLSKGEVVFRGSVPDLEASPDVEQQFIGITKRSETALTNHTRSAS